PDPQPSHSDRAVEATPTVLPAVTRVDAGRAAERLPEPLLARRVRVGDELDAVAPLDLLEARGEELEHPRSRLLEPRGGDIHRDAAERAQRNALFSFSKKPSSRR